MQFNKLLIGQTITDIRLMTKTEMQAEGWEVSNSSIFVIVLSNGAMIYPSRDDEGNGSGVFFGVDTKGKTFTLRVA